jgi:membrane protein YqaA with SNARE-associated domain
MKNRRKQERGEYIRAKIWLVVRRRPQVSDVKPLAKCGARTGNSLVWALGRCRERTGKESKRRRKREQKNHNKFSKTGAANNRSQP